MISADNFQKFFAKSGAYCKEVIALFDTFWSSGRNLMIHLDGHPPEYQMTECPLDLTLSSLLVPGVPVSCKDNVLL